MHHKFHLYVLHSWRRKEGKENKQQNEKQNTVDKLSVFKFLRWEGLKYDYLQAERKLIDKVTSHKSYELNEECKEF